MAITTGCCTLLFSFVRHDPWLRLTVRHFFLRLFSVRKLYVCTEIEIPHRMSVWMSTVFFLSSLFPSPCCLRVPTIPITYCRNMDCCFKCGKKHQHSLTSRAAFGQIYWLLGNSPNNISVNITNCIASCADKVRNTKNVVATREKWGWKPKGDTITEWCAKLSPDFIDVELATDVNQMLFYWFVLALSDSYLRNRSTVEIGLDVSLIYVNSLSSCIRRFGIFNNAIHGWLRACHYFVSHIYCLSVCVFFVCLMPIISSGERKKLKQICYCKKSPTREWEWIWE